MGARPLRGAIQVLTIVAVLLVGAPLDAQDLVFNLFRDYLESLRMQAGIPALSAAVVGTDDIIWEHAFGRQDVQRAIATRTDTPFHLDGLTQVFTASLVLRCVEEGRLSLDDRIGRFQPDNPDANATIQEILTHTSGASDGLDFAYRPERFGSLRFAVEACTGEPFRATLASLLERLGMADSVPGPDAVQPLPPGDGLPHGTAVDRYARALDRLATPYRVDAQRRPFPSAYAATTLTPASGLISTVLDLARFDTALKNGVLLHGDTLAQAWRAPSGRYGHPLPHALGWFIQTYKGEPVVWQFGVGEDASSSLVVTLPTRGFTLILLANSDGLVKPFGLAAGDVTASPFARLFLELFAR